MLDLSYLIILTSKNNHKNFLSVRKGVKTENADMLPKKELTKILNLKQYFFRNPFKCQCEVYSIMKILLSVLEEN